ncbi:hypothetical protein P4W10_22345, partial [Bacillus thuringiensis]|nr:hypothetical protein [Bacillus thuringiensis]
MKRNKKMKKRTFLELTLLVLYLMVGLNILLKADIGTLIQIAEEQAFLLQKIIMIFVFMGTIFTSFYYITLQKEQADERKKAKSLLAMYIVVTIMALFSSDIANY